MNSPAAEPRPSVLFVCRHNTGRSQMAEAYLRHFLGDRVDVASAGTVAAELPDPGVVAVMAEDGIDISAARPKLLDAGRAARADRIITMGCDVAGASTTIGVCRIRKASRSSECGRYARWFAPRHRPWPRICCAISASGSRRSACRGTR
jgi:protein-tyrosine-phosphatase